MSLGKLLDLSESLTVGFLGYNGGGGGGVCVCVLAEHSAWQTGDEYKVSKTNRTLGPVSSTTKVQCKG